MKDGGLPHARLTLAHGAGGKAMRDLIDEVFAPAFAMRSLALQEDQARIELDELTANGDRLAFTTDSYVVSPLFFPGGDIGTLAVNGTINDLAMGGARPLYLSCSVIAEEGLDVQCLRDVALSMAASSTAAGVRIVTGDTKVVPHGAADKLFVNTAGIGVIARELNIAATRARHGDVVIVNGTLGDHGAAILAARQDLGLAARIASDCQPLHGLVQAMLAIADVHCLRDATRGGVASVLNELAAASSVGIRIDEARIPMLETVRGLCEILGLDPLYLANEGKLVAIVPSDAADAVLAAMHAHPCGRAAAAIGEVIEDPAGMVTMNTAFGGERIVDMLVGEQLPRIC